MREIYETIALRLCGGSRFAVATLVASGGAKASAIGTSLVVDADGTFLGDIGAGCHEGSIVQRALELLADSEPRAEQLTFDLDDEVLAGSGCGASLDVVLWIPGTDFAPVAQAVTRGEVDVTFTLGESAVTIPRKQRLVVVGATALAAQLTAIAGRADFAVTVVDPRPPFASRARHPDADEILCVWPDDPVAVARMEDAAAIAVLSHDVKIDVPALAAALATLAGYVGLLGNRRVQRARRDALRGLGYDDATLARLRGPVGFDIGAQTDGQTAVSILSEIVAVLNERTGAPLTGSSGPIH